MDTHQEGETGNEAVEARNETTQATESSAVSTGLIIGVVLGVVLLLGTLYWFTMGGSDVNREGQQAVTSYPDVVARINGEEISKADYEESVAQVSVQAAQLGQDPTLPETKLVIEEQAISLLINNRLLLQAADKEEIVVGDKEIDDAIDAIVQSFGGKEALEAEMARLGISANALREDVRQQLAIDVYVTGSEEVSSIVITDEEARTLYDSYVVAGQELPPYEEVVDQIKVNLETEAQRQILNTIIERLRTEALIERFI